MKNRYVDCLLKTTCLQEKSVMLTKVENPWMTFKDFQKSLKSLKSERSLNIFVMPFKGFAKFLAVSLLIATS